MCDLNVKQMFLIKSNSIESQELQVYQKLSFI